MITRKISHTIHFYCFYLLLLFCYVQSGYSQPSDLKFQHFNDDKGLSQNTILDLIQDADGYLWIGTANGLFKYDGFRFQVYRNQNTTTNQLVNNIVNTLAVDHNGDIWIGTTRGLSKFNKTKQCFETLFTIIQDKHITSIFPNIDGSIWVGTKESGLYHLANTPTLNFTHQYFYQPNKINSINSNQILSIAKDANNKLWIGTNVGLNYMVQKRNNIGFKPVNNIQEQINSIFLDSKKRLWFGGTGKKIYSLQQNNTSEPTFKKHFLNINSHKKGIIYDIKEDLNKNLWVCGHDYGAIWYEPDTGNSKLYAPNSKDPNSIENSRVKTLLIDKTNVLWVGNFVGGLNKTDLERKDITLINYNLTDDLSLSDPSVNCILKEHKFIWVGTENGLNRIDITPKGKPKAPYKKYLFDQHLQDVKKDGKVRSIFKDKDGDYWIGQGNSVTHMRIVNNEPKFTKTELNLPEVFSILQDREGYLWFGSFTKGLMKWKKKKHKTKDQFDFEEAIYYHSDLNNPTSISDDLISSIYEDKKGNLWIGTLQGGVNLRVTDEISEKDSFISFQHDPSNANSLSHNSVFSIHQDQNGTYWLGTFGGGLNKMTWDLNKKKKPQFTHYFESDGLSNNAIYGVLEEDNGTLWLSTDYGISSFNQETEEFKTFNKGDGLQSNNFRKNAYLQDEAGNLYFGGLRGLNIFNPKKLTFNKLLATPKITEIEIKNEPILVGATQNGRIILDTPISKTKKRLKFNYDENTLTFEFAALHFAAPYKNKFQYQLEGFDKTWQDSKGFSFAHYTNLSPGNYTFRVKASNNDAVWNDTPAQIRFKIAPPYWLSWWAFVLYFLIISAIISSVLSYFKLQNKEKNAIKVQKEIEEVNRLKLQFFTNISHDFRTPITLILNPIEDILESKNPYPALRPKLKIIERNANYLLRLVNQLMEFRKIEVGETKLASSKSNIVNFVREITFSFKTHAHKNNIELNFDSKIYSTELWFDWDKMEKILHNIIFNAIKFTPEHGSVSVKISKAKDDTLIINEMEEKINFIKIEVKDTGIGISNDELPFIFQRFYQVNKGKNKSNKGSGIGLAITKDLIDLHQGKIEVTSQEGEGSIFKIFLPLGNLHLKPSEIVENPTPTILSEEELDKDFISNNEQEFSETKFSKHKTTVLVVDDNQDIRELVKSSLSNKHNIFEAENGQEALNIALKEIPDIIISDVLMPVMDGIELCKQLKSNIRTSHIPIVLLTALYAVEHRIQGLESGADAYLPKPFKMKLLSVRVDKLIESRVLMQKRFQTEKQITPAKVTVNSVDREFLEKIMSLMEENMGNENYWIDQLAADMHASRSTFFRKLKKLTGLPPNDFIRGIRLKRALQLLEQNQLSVAEISYRVGFNDPGYFGKCFRKVYGSSPSKYLKSLAEKAKES